MAALGGPADLLARRPALPGSELVYAGLRDLADGRESVAALLVASFSTRLRALSLPVPRHSIPHPELRLYLRLAHERPDAHHHYNGLVLRLVSFAEAAECLACFSELDSAAKSRIIAPDVDDGQGGRFRV